MVRRHISPHRTAQLAAYARRMRFEATSSEARLWQALSGKKLGVSFKRQVPLGGWYVVDFLASREKLIVEVDGECHARRTEIDARRDRALRRLGYRVLRLDAELVMSRLPEALARIRAALSQIG